MSFYPNDFTNSFSESFLVEVTKTISKEKNKQTDKTEVELEPTLDTKPVDDEEALDTDTDKTKKTKKASVKEKYNVTFSDKEIEFFDSIINKEGTPH